MGPDALRQAQGTPGPTILPFDPSAALRFGDVSVDYGKRLGRPAFRALHDITFELYAGEVLGVVGESGSGKTTLALDVSVQARILELFAELQELHDFACLFISHDLAVVHEVSNDVLVLHRGRVVESGPARHVLLQPARPYTRQLVQALPVPDPIEQRLRRTR